MFDVVPDSWRQALGHLRESIHHSLDRWLHHDHAAEETRPGSLVRPPAGELTRHDTSRLPMLFTLRGPVVDIDETDDELIVSAEMPGLERDDFKVEVTGQRLVIRGEKKQALERQEQGYTYAERRYGAFAHAVSLPCEIATEKVKARYKNGVLRITLPKTAQAKAKRITVKVSG